MTKRDEIGKLLEARKDPSLLEKVLSSELSPAQASMQDRMTRTIEVSAQTLHYKCSNVNLVATHVNLHTPYFTFCSRRLTFAFVTWRNM